MGVTSGLPKNAMLAMIRNYYREKGAFFQPPRLQRLVAVDDIAFKPWIIEGKAHPKKWLCCGIICFEQERSEKQVFSALQAAEKTYNLQEYEVWCHPLYNAYSIWFDYQKDDVRVKKEAIESV